MVRKQGWGCRQGLKLNQDGGVEESVQAYVFCEDQGVCERLQQKEWTADALSLCCSYWLCPWIYTADIQPVHTGKDRKTKTPDE